MSLNNSGHITGDPLLGFIPVDLRDSLGCPWKFWANQQRRQGWPNAVQQSGYHMVHDGSPFFSTALRLWSRPDLPVRKPVRNPTSLKMRSTGGENVLNGITCPVPDSFATGYEQLMFRYDLINDIRYCSSIKMPKRNERITCPQNTAKAY